MPSASSSPTPRTSCAPRWPGSGSSARSPWRDPGATVETLSTAHERVLASGAQQQQLIDARLTLARGQSGLDKLEPFDLAAVTRQVLAARQSEADYRNLTLHAALGPAPAAGSPRLAERLAANLVDNALRHNVRGGRVEVTAGTRNSCTVLSAANTGPAVPAAAVDRLFWPFQRLGADRTSRGPNNPGSVNDRMLWRWWRGWVPPQAGIV